MAAIKFRVKGGPWIKIYTIKGDDGHTPVIDISNETGNWTIDGVDTGKPAIAKVDENVQIVYTEAETKTNIASGESIGTIFGKIKKWFTSFGALAWKSSVDFATEVTNKETTLAGYGITDAYTKTGSEALITQLIDGASDNTLKKLQDKIVALQSIVGGTTPNGNGIIDTVTELLSVFNSYPEGSDLATLLSAKVNVTDVYNALDCIVSGKTLDARQGKILNDAISALSSGKVDKIAGKGLSTEDYTTAEKTKLGGIAAGAEVNVQPDWNQTNTAAKDFIKNKPIIPNVSNDFTNDYKGLLDRVSGFNLVSTLASLPVTKQSIIASVSAATTISLAATLANGLLLHIKVYNISGSAITQDLPTTGSFESKKTDGTNKTSISIPAGGNAEISIWAVNNKYIIKTDI